MFTCASNTDLSIAALFSADMSKLVVKRFDSKIQEKKTLPRNAQTYSTQYRGDRNGETQT